MATTKPKKNSGGASAFWGAAAGVWAGVGALVLVAAVVAFVASSGSGDKEKGSGANENSAVVDGEARPVTVTGAALPEFEPDGADSAVGQTIPEVKGQSFDGSPVEIGKDGRSKLIVFVAHWCPHCQKEIPLLADWLKSNSLPGGVDLYTVSTGVTDKRPNYPPSAWLKEEGWTAKTLADSDEQQAADAFGLSAFPYFVAVDGSGKVVVRTSGEITTGQFVELAQSALSNR